MKILLFTGTLKLILTKPPGLIDCEMIIQSCFHIAYRHTWVSRHLFTSVKLILNLRLQHPLERGRSIPDILRKSTYLEKKIIRYETLVTTLQTLFRRIFLKNLQNPWKIWFYRIEVIIDPLVQPTASTGSDFCLIWKFCDGWTTCVKIVNTNGLGFGEPRGSM